MSPSQKLWAAHAGGFLVTVTGIVALGALLGAISFPLAGRLIGSHKGAMELFVFGAKTLGFYFFVWAPGIALVREVMRAAARKAAGKKTSGNQ